MSLSKTVSLALLALMMCSTTSAQVRQSALMSLIWLVLVFHSRFVAATRIVVLSRDRRLSPSVPFSLDPSLSRSLPTIPSRRFASNDRYPAL